MYEYGMVKSIHDQRMRQFMNEAERAHLLRQLRRSHSVRQGLVQRSLLRLHEAFEAAGAALRPKRLST